MSTPLVGCSGMFGRLNPSRRPVQPMGMRTAPQRLELGSGPEICRRRSARSALPVWRIVWSNRISKNQTAVCPVFNTTACLEKLSGKLSTPRVNDGDHLTRSSTPPDHDRERSSEIRTTSRAFPQARPECATVPSASQQDRGRHTRKLLSDRVIIELEDWPGCLRPERLLRHPSPRDSGAKQSTQRRDYGYDLEPGHLHCSRAASNDCGSPLTDPDRRPSGAAAGWAASIRVGQPLRKTSPF
jgi:hypothetical protein